MKFTMHLIKPDRKMKTVAFRMEKCLQNDCAGCWLKEDQHCQDKLMYSALYYMRQTIEKSERKKDVSKVR